MDDRKGNQEQGQGGLRKEFSLDNHDLLYQVSPSVESSVDSSVLSDEPILSLWGNQRPPEALELTASAAPSVSFAVPTESTSQSSRSSLLLDIGAEEIRCEAAYDSSCPESEEPVPQLCHSSGSSSSGCLQDSESFHSGPGNLHDLHSRRATNTKHPPSSFMSARSSTSYSHGSPHRPHRASSTTKSRRRQGHVDMTAHDVPPVPSVPQETEYVRPSNARASAPVAIAPQQNNQSTRAKKRANRHSHSGHLYMAGTSFETAAQQGPSYGRQSLDGASPRQPLYTYIRPNADRTLSLSPSASPSRSNGFPSSMSSSRSGSLDIARSSMPSSRRPTSASTTHTSRSVSSPRSSVDTARPSKFLDIPYREGMSAEEVQLPGPESLTPPGQGIPIRFGGGSVGHRTGASMSGQMEQYMSFAAPNENGEFETASGRYKFKVDSPKQGKEGKKKAGSWKRLSAGFRSLVGSK